jgi:hypothetical protein
MEEEYHAKFAVIPQIIYQCERLTYFSNHVAITLNLTNKVKKINWCSIMLTVATLALGSRPKQRGCKGAGQEEARESH